MLQGKEKGKKEKEKKKLCQNTNPQPFEQVVMISRSHQLVNFYQGQREHCFKISHRNLEIPVSICHGFAHHFGDEKDNT